MPALNVLDVFAGIPSAESVSGCNAPGCASPDSASPTRSADACSQSTGQACPVTPTCEASPPHDLPQMELPLISSAAAGLVRTSRSLAKVPDFAASDQAYGRSSPELLARFDRAGCCWRTSQLCLDGELTKFAETWPRSFIVVRGTLFQLPPLALRTSEIEFGLLPTPSAEPYGTNQGGGMGRVGPVRPSLETMARKNLWPTPTAGDAKDSGSRNTPSSNAHPGTSLTDAVRSDGGRGRMWPTPTARDAETPAKAMRGAGSLARGQERIVPLAVEVTRYPTPRAADGNGGKPRTDGKAQGLNQVMFPSPAARDYRSGRGRSPNGHTPQLPEVIGAQLSADWVELLMGFPKGWTRLPDAGAPAGRTQRRASSRKRRTRSTGASG